jgi:addiction module HigA family antidote
MVTKTDAYPDVAIPPGEYLAEEIKERGTSQKELARRMGRPLNAINEIIHGKKAITAETALQLEEVMPEIPARFWLNLETDYQLARALINRRPKVAQLPFVTSVQTSRGCARICPASRHTPVQH